MCRPGANNHLNGPFSSKFLQGGPLPVVNGVITPINGLINRYITGIITLLLEVTTSSITGRGPTLYVFEKHAMRSMEMEGMP